MNNFLDWKFERMLTPVLMQVVNGIILVASVLAGFGVIVVGLVKLSDNVATMLLGGLGLMLVVPVLSRILHEIAIVTFRIATVSKSVKELLARHMEYADAPGIAVPPAPPPLPFSQPPPLP